MGALGETERANDMLQSEIKELLSDQVTPLAARIPALMHRICEASTKKTRLVP